MRDMLMGADAFVLPTRGEGWGLPVMEAMAMALPVIVTNTSGCSQYLTHDNSFPLTPTPTPDGFSEPHVPQLQARSRRAALHLRLHPPKCVRNACAGADAQSVRERELRRRRGCR
jgi:glycogen synthase